MRRGLGLRLLVGSIGKLLLCGSGLRRIIGINGIRGGLFKLLIGGISLLLSRLLRRLGLLELGICIVRLLSCLGLRRRCSLLGAGCGVSLLLGGLLGGLGALHGILRLRKIGCSLLNLGFSIVQRLLCSLLACCGIRRLLLGLRLCFRCSFSRGTGVCFLFLGFSESRVCGIGTLLRFIKRLGSLNR